MHQVGVLKLWCNFHTMYFDFAISSRTWESAVVAASILKMSVLNGQDSLSSLGKDFISSCFNDLLIPFVPNHFCSGLGDFANQFYSVCFANFNVAKIFCKDSFFFCKSSNKNNVELNWKLFFFSKHMLLQRKTSALPSTVSMPEVLAVLTSQEYSASSSRRHLLMTRMRTAPLDMMSYFLPFLISAPSLNHWTYIWDT